ncbi:MAG: 3-deoxy-7-phosphoheptulonate synthase [Alphaproteobacteria bacterium]|nr:3-deoxy-7-phosphoheptulonate synthase [Alphaproteobacteria bacterium]
MLKAHKNESDGWSPQSWREKEALQLPYSADLDALAAVAQALEASPPLVSAADTRRLKELVAKAAKGEAFLLQAGDCAESFAEFHPDNVRATFDTLAQMAKIIAKETGKPVVLNGRIAGQFAKPRSDSNETQGGVTLPSYKGDIINGLGFTPGSRRPEAERMLRAYRQCAVTLNLLRGFAAETETEFFTAHEALLLPYEEPLVRRDPATGAWHASSAHFLWAGNRTCAPDGAHVAFLRGVANPVGVKCGPEMTPETLLRLLDVLAPANDAGRVTLIARMGRGRIAAALPPLVRAARSEGRIVAWVCDPMHGNTTRAASGLKTRAVADILAETQSFLSILAAESAVAGGLHLELSGRDVTECTGGAITEADLPKRYLTHCDPRLNAAQGLSLARAVAEALR